MYVAGATFPHTSIRDCVNLHGAMLRGALGLTEVMAVIGGSMGGSVIIDGLL